MALSTLAALLAASPFASSLLPLAGHLLPTVLALARLVVRFRQTPLCPQATCAFENDLQELLREIGRILMQWVLNSLEPTDPEQAPATVRCDGNLFRRRGASPRRGGIATLFGIIPLTRLRYEPWDEGIGLSCIFPLEQRLGIVAGKATVALASRVGVWTAQHPQAAVLDLLAQEQRVSWSVATLRAVTAHLRAAQTERLLQWLHHADISQGRHRPVLAVGRDGIFVPVVKDTKYREAATATVSVYDRSGQRLGTVYLGQMPEPGQQSLSGRLTELIRAVLAGWDGALPRLQYITDGGHHPTEYFGGVLRCMRHPRTAKELTWEWTLDYYHACGYVSKLAEALFGKQTQHASAWAAKMRRWLRDRRGGIFRVLHSAAAHRWRGDLTAEERRAYEEAYEYLRKRMGWMDYWDCRRRGLGIGSGVTEAGCKTLFTQRFKQSGMKWSLEGGQVVVELRMIWLSRLWDNVYQAYLQGMPQAQEGTKRAADGLLDKMAA